MKRIGISMSVIHKGVKYAAGYAFEERLMTFSREDGYKSTVVKIEKPWTYSTGKVERMIRKHFGI